MKKAIPVSLVIALTFILSFCAPSRFVKTLKKGERAAAFTFGGPLIKFGGAPIPIPFTTLLYGYGLNDKSTVFGSLHTTSLLFGNFQTDIGSVIRLFEKENKYGLTLTPAIQIAYSVTQRKDLRLWPSADLNFYIHPKNKQSFFYAGLNSWFELSSKKAHDQKQQKHMIPNLQIGYTFVRTKWMHQLEAKYLGIGIANTPGVVEYNGISGKGTAGIYYALIRKF